jgi:cobalt-zinc-cadmium efflux system outer membrane protein
MWYRILALALVWSGAAAAADAPLTLEAAVDQALRQAPEIVSSTAMLDAARAAQPAAGRLPDPELVVGIENLPIDKADSFSFTAEPMTMQKIGVMQGFPNARKRKLQRDRAHEQIAIAQADLRKTQFDAARAVADSWIAAAQAADSAERLRELKPDVDLQVASARAALASGRSSAADALAMQLLGARLDDRIHRFDQEVDIRRAELARWIGADAADRPFGPLPVDRELGHSPESLVAGVEEHPPLAPVVARIAAAQTDVELARAEKRPDWSAGLSFAKRAPDLSNMVSLEFRVGLPLFTAHRQDPMIAEKLGEVRAEEAERDAEVRMHTAEIRTAAAEWRHGRQRLEVFKTELLPLARERSRAAVASYGSGRGDLRSTVDALSEEIDTRLDYVELEGAVSRAWMFLHFLHDAGGMP